MFDRDKKSGPVAGEASLIDTDMRITGSVTSVGDIVLAGSVGGQRIPHVPFRNAGKYIYIYIYIFIHAAAEVKESLTSHSGMQENTHIRGC